MLNDRNAVFRHNSCKKVAQLVKVIHQLWTELNDRDDATNEIISEGEATISHIVHQHIMSTENIARDLVSFRKSCIDSACEAYAVHFKQIKSGYSKLCKSKVNELQAISNEIDDLQNLVNSFYKASANEAKLTLDKGDDVEKEINKTLQNLRLNINNRIWAAQNQIYEKIKLADLEFQKKNRHIMIEHKKNVKNKKQEKFIFWKEEILRRKAAFDGYKNSLKSLENDVSSLKTEYLNQMKIFQNTKSSNKNQRKAIMLAIKNYIKGIKIQVANMGKEFRNNEFEKKHRINELNKQKQTLVNSYQNDIKSLNLKISSIESQILQLTRSKSQELQRRQLAFDSLTNNMKKDHLNVLNAKKSDLEHLSRSIADSENDISLIKSHLHSILEESSVKATNRQLTFHHQLEKELTSLMTSFENELHLFQDLSRKRVNTFLSIYQSQEDFNYICQKERRQEIHRLLEILKTQLADNAKQLKEKIDQAEKEKSNYKNTNDSLKKNKENELNQILESKRANNERQINSIKENYSKNLKQKLEEHDRENRIKLNDFKESLMKSINFDEEENAHKTSILKLEGKLNFFKDQLHQAKQTKEQKISFLQNEISNFEKTIRQIKRRIKTETQAIDDEYETQIQVAQVNLETRIDNLSKLYNKEENARGAELIEAIRKLRQIKNWTIDLVNKTENDIEEEEQQYQKMKKELENEIECLNKNETIQELKVKLTSLTETQAKILNETTADLEQKLHKITLEIEQIQKANETKINEYQNKISQQREIFEDSMNELKKQKETIEVEARSQILNCETKFNKQKEELINRHNAQVESLKHRIESAKQRESEMVTKAGNKLTLAIKTDEDLLSRKYNNDFGSFEQASNDFIQNNMQLTKAIKGLTKKQSLLETQRYIMPMRKIEEQMLSNSKDYINKKDKEIEELFDTFCNSTESIQHIPLSKLSPSASSSLISSSSSNIIHSRNSNSRRFTKSPKFESRKFFDSRKHFPTILPPQIV